MDSNGKKVNLKQSYLSGPNFGLDLTFYVNVYEKLVGKVTGATRRVGNSSFMTYNLNNGVFVAPGKRVFTSIDREFKSILPKPYSNCELAKNLPKSDLHTQIIQSDYSYTKQFCLSQCLQKQFIKKYNCSLHFDLSIFNLSECDANLSFASNDFSDSNFVWPQLCLPLCRLECEQTFKKSISF
jgi:hypothetical protein